MLRICENNPYVVADCDDHRLELALEHGLGKHRHMLPAQKLSEPQMSTMSGDRLVDKLSLFDLNNNDDDDSKHDSVEDHS